MKKFGRKVPLTGSVRSFKSLIGQMLRQKWSHFGVLQKLVHSRRGLHEREELEVAQTDVDTAELAYIVGRVANKAD
jgi:hypothetical protein